MNKTSSFLSRKRLNPQGNRDDDARRGLIWLKNAVSGGRSAVL
jgi:hypothetical protein